MRDSGATEWATSTRYRNPQARLLDSAEWEAVKDDVLTTLGLPEDPGALLASHVTALDEALKYVAGRLAANADGRVDEADRIHVTSDKAIAEPPSLVDPRKRVAAMLPRVDIGEQILEVMGWVPQFLESLTALSGRAAPAPSTAGADPELGCLRDLAQPRLFGVRLACLSACPASAQRHRGNEAVMSYR